MLRLANCAVLLLMAGSILAQSSAPKGAKQKKPDAAQEPVAPDDFVILLTGACQTPPGDFAVRDCIRGVTREEFEALLSSFGANQTPQSKLHTAEELGQILIVSNEAKKEDLTKDPEVKQLMRVAQLQVLAQQLLTHTVKDIEAKITDADVEAYYQAHIDDYKKDDLERVIVPSKEKAATDDDEKYAEALRARWAAGEDPVKLQAEASQRVGQVNAPEVELKGQSVATTPLVARSIFSLKAGEICAPIKDGSQLYIYKVVTATNRPLAEVRPAIIQTLKNERVAEVINTLKKSNVISLNSKYFDTQTGPTPAKTSAPK